MGRIKTKKIKSVSHELFAENSSQLGTTFEENKQKLAEIADFRSKKIRNIVAGYLTRLKQKEREI